MITPTVGRVVWFYQAGIPERIQPQAALIAFVHSDSLVNLAVFDANGVAEHRTSVLLYQGEGDRPESEFCEWMPYQIGKAKEELQPVRRIQPIEVGPQG